MERYDNIVKSSEIRKLVDKKMYQKALTILETIDVPKIKVLTDLSVYAEVYIQTGKYKEAERLLLRIHSKTNSRRIIKQLIKLAIKTKNEEEAERYYDEYVMAAPNDSDRYILRYRIDRMKDADIAVLIASLETLKEHDYIEKWCYELAKLYHRAGMKEKCIKECSDIILWFGEGVIVEKAKMLQAMYETEQDTEKTKMDTFSKNQKTLENNPEFEYNHKSLQEIPNEGDAPVDYEYIYNNEQLQAIFKSYFKIEELKGMIGSYLDQAIKEEKASSFAIQGRDAESRTFLAKAMAKSIHELHIYESSRLAKITASRLNEIDLEANYEKLKDSFLVIEEAAALSLSAKNNIVGMVKAMEGHMVVILQDNEEGLKTAMEGSEAFASLFVTTLEIAEHSKEELLAMALKMLQDAEFELDDEANVCLETACNQIAATVIDRERISSLKKLIGKVLEHAEERSVHDIALSNGRIDYDKSDINKIIASDF